MTVRISKPKISLREILTSLINKGEYAQEVFWFNGNGTTTTFTLPIGWKPKFIYVNGALRREGSSEDYTVSYDGFQYSIVLASAPSAVDIGIICNRLV